MKKKILITVLLLFVTGVSVGYYLFNKKHQSIANEKPAFSLKADALVTEYDSNEKTANQKYLGKVVEVEGVIAEKVKDKKGSYNITLQGPDLAGIGCEFEQDAQSNIAQLKEGQQVKIKGICTGVLMDVVMVDCVCVNNDVNKNIE